MKTNKVVIYIVVYLMLTAVLCYIAYSNRGYFAVGSEFILIPCCYAIINVNKFWE